MSQLFPKPPKRKRQPTAECYREQLVLAADEIERLRNCRAYCERQGWPDPVVYSDAAMSIAGNGAGSVLYLPEPLRIPLRRAS